MGRTTAILAALVLAAVLAGCAAAPPITYYRVEPDLQAQPAKPLPMSINVAPLRSAEPLARANILRRTTALTLQHYPDRLWETPPVDQVSQSLVMAFRNSGLFESVGARRLEGRADLTLTGVLTRFEEVSGPGGTTAEVGMWLELHATEAGRSLWSGEIVRGVPVAGANAEALAAAMGRALAAAIQETLAQVGRAAAGHRTGR